MEEAVDMLKQKNMLLHSESDLFETVQENSGAIMAMIFDFFKAVMMEVTDSGFDLLKLNNV